MALGILNLRRAGCYSLYVLALLLFAYLLNQLDRYTLPIVAIPIAQELQYGDKGCMNDPKYGEDVRGNASCKAESQNECMNITGVNETSVCQWNYNGQGYQYQLLAGPIFVLIYTLMGIFLGIAADYFNRKNLLAACLILWSATTLVTGLVASYWELAMARFGLGLSEAGCTPFAASLIADYFTEDLRGSALGVYNWGIYTGYSLSFALGNFITKANIYGQGWRWVFIISGIPGILLGIVVFLTLREPERKNTTDNAENVDVKRMLIRSQKTTCGKLCQLLRPFARPSLIMLCIAGSIRNGGGYIWAYNTQVYFESIGQSKEQIGMYMSWIPLVGGSFGAVLGGIISDKLVEGRGIYARVIVLIASQFFAAPFAAGALFLPAPWCYVSLIPANIIGEMWVGVTLAVVLELVPSAMKTSAVAVYLFIITNIGGNMPLLVPPLKTAFRSLGLSDTDSLRDALYILYPGMYVLGGLIFLATMCLLKRDSAHAQQTLYVPVDTEDTTKLVE